MKPFVIGLIVNPIAGMGGSVGLKGTDGLAEKAKELGAKSHATGRAAEALKIIANSEIKLKFLTCSGEMGETAAKSAGVGYEIIFDAKPPTTAEDTKNAARLLKEKIDLLMFCGGDGTAADILELVDGAVPVVGIPAGVKMHSGVFAVNPRCAGELAVQFVVKSLPLREVDVVDVDEDMFRQGKVSARIKGHLMTPYEPELVQSSKGLSPSTADEAAAQHAIARRVVSDMKNDVVYVLGPGSTVRKISEILGLDKTELGVDLVENRKLIAKDANEVEILEKIKGKKAVLVISPIGRQGFIFGRGNQQLSPAVIKQSTEIIVVATPSKVGGLKNLRVDTGDEGLDKALSGYMRVLTDYNEVRMVMVKLQ